MYAPKFNEFKDKYGHNLNTLLRDRILKKKSYTYSNCDAKRLFNKNKFHYNKSKSLSTKPNIHKKSDIHAKYKEYKYYYNTDGGYYKNRPEYNRDQTFRSFNNNKYYFNTSINDRNVEKMSKYDAIKSEIDESIENRFITLFFFKLYRLSLGL